jgi:hypothetical protein
MFKVGDRVQMLRSQICSRYYGKYEGQDLSGTYVGRSGAPDCIQVKMDVDGYIGNWFQYRFEPYRTVHRTPFEQSVADYIQAELGSHHG